MEHIPFVVHEADMTRLERTNRRVWILCIILAAMLFGTNAGWLYYESQFEIMNSTTEITQENESGFNNYIGNDGDIHNGEADNQGNNNQ